MRILSFCLLVLLSSGFGLAQGKTAAGDWESKPLDQWNEVDVKAILEKSAWGKTLEGRLTDATRIGRITQPGYARFSLRSALVIRLALIRNLQIAEKYESMSGKEKAAFNSKYKAVLDCALCEKYYIIAVGGDSRILQNAVTMNRRSDSIYLSNEKGERRTLEKYSPQTTPGSEALFFFPRLDKSGKPLLDSGNVTLTFHLPSEPDDDPVVRVLDRVELKVQDLVREKIVIF